jgi:hypothetical protein
MTAANWFNPWTSPVAGGGYTFKPEHLNLRALYDYRNSTSTTMVDQSLNGLTNATVGGGSNSPLWLPYTEPRVHLTGKSYLQLVGTPPTFAAGEFTAVLDIDAFNWNHAGISRWSYNWNGSHSILLATVSGGITIFGAGTSFASTGHPASGRVQWRLRRNGNTSASVAWRTDGVTDPNASGWTVSGTGVLTDSIPTSNLLGDSTDSTEGFVYSVAHYDGAGIKKAEFNPAICGQTGYTDSFSGLPWTVFRVTTGRKLVVQSPAAGSAKSLWLFGTDDVINVPATAVPAYGSASPGAILVFVRSHHFGSNNYFCGNLTGGVGPGNYIARLTSNNAYSTIANSVPAATSPAIGWTGTTELAMAGQSISATQIKTLYNSTSSAYLARPAGSVDSATGYIIGGYAAPSAGASDFELLGWLSMDREPTATEIGLLNTFYGAGV